MFGIDLFQALIGMYSLWNDNQGWSLKKALLPMPQKIFWGFWEEIPMSLRIGIQNLGAIGLWSGSISIHLLEMMIIVACLLLLLIALLLT